MTERREPPPPGPPRRLPSLIWWAPGGGALADWQNPEEYAYTETMTLHDWAWEFLRRDSRYRDDWKRLSQPGTKRSASEFLEAHRIGDKYACTG